MRQFFAILLSVLILAACTVPQSIPDTPTVSANSQNCIYAWATQPLPELSEKVQAAISAAGLTGVNANVEAYGENCIDSQTNRSVRFSTLETDFYIIVKVANLTDEDNMGNFLEKILVVLDTFPAGKIPGPQPGNIAVSFRTGSDELNLLFTVSAGKSARLQGLRGAKLLEKLQKT